ncbi:hypothetical protein F2Q68_00021756 [Brassica cretica]|uniref:Uncharacterized protein n=1 Tax=Brassica cretica TaxID=69181 RepID=A0A8S9FS75_BRACR|nr:hypothetical protein F2Q68_00021756 [Brassica cretica]
MFVRNPNFRLFHREVSAIVVDLGLPTCKASYVGEDAPKAVFPSVKLTLFSPELGVIVVGAVAVDVDVDSSKTNSNSEDPKSEKGRVNASSTSCLIIDPKEHPMLLAEPPLNTQQGVDYSAFRKNLQVSKSSGCKTDSLTEWDIPSGDTSCVYFFYIVETSLCYSPGYTMPDYMEYIGFCSLCKGLLFIFLIATGVGNSI